MQRCLRIAPITICSGLALSQSGKIRPTSLAARCAIRVFVACFCIERMEQWVVTQRRDKTHAAWIATCVAAIAEQLESESYPDQVCGIVVSVRKNQDRLSVWIRSGVSNESVVLAIGNRWKSVLRGGFKLGFQVCFLFACVFVCSHGGSLSRFTEMHSNREVLLDQGMPY